MGNYKAVLFDFGNVVIDIDPELTLHAFSELSGKSVERVRSVISESQLFRRYETGAFDDDEFREIVRQTLGYPFSDDEVDKAWNALLLDVPPHRIDLILDLKANHKVFLLSNTNSLHINACDSYFRQQFGMDSVASLFDKAFYSYEMGLWKPEEQIYLQVLAETGLVAEEILFIDDNQSNIESAKKLGFQTIHLIPPDDITNHFDLKTLEKK
jgi:HAD superfamily hydrolase (TIGR01509 family)